MLEPPQVAFRDSVHPSDPVAIRRIVESTSFFRPDEVEVAVELAQERLAKGEASGYFFVFAEFDGGVAGYACYGPIACTLGSFDLYWLAVDQAHQGRGLGRLLVRECERRIRLQGGRRIYIETSGRPQYKPTRRFYEHCDYQTVAVLADFYDSGDDKVILVKRIDEIAAGV